MNGQLRLRSGWAPATGCGALAEDLEKKLDIFSVIEGEFDAAGADAGSVVVVVLDEPKPPMAVQPPRTSASTHTAATEVRPRHISKYCFCAIVRVHRKKRATLPTL